jgi:hypothetical protein
MTSRTEETDRMTVRSMIVTLVCLIGMSCSLGVVANAEEVPLKQAQQSFQEQVRSVTEQLKKATEVRDAAVKVFSDEVKGMLSAPEQISNMIGVLRELNASYDEGSKFKTALDEIESALDAQIAAVLSDPNPKVQAAADTLKARRDRIFELKKYAAELVEQGKKLESRLEENRRVAEILIQVEKLDTVISVAQEALDQYATTLNAIQGITDRSNTLVPPGS